MKKLFACICFLPIVIVRQQVREKGGLEAYHQLLNIIKETNTSKRHDNWAITDNNKDILIPFINKYGMDFDIVGFCNMCDCYEGKFYYDTNK
jgi:hypothetical protein